jgi:hypothetical protein
MIAHVVLFKPRAGLTDSERRGAVEALTKAVEAIPSIQRARIGRRVTLGRGYETLMKVDYAFTAIFEFEDIRGLRAYLEHPAHDALASTAFALFEEALMYDFELTEAGASAHDLGALGEGDSSR